MRAKWISAAILCLLCAACGTMPYNPTEHVLRDTAIDDFPLNGNITIVNGQQSERQQIVYSTPGARLESDYRAVTEVMVKQTRAEINRHGIRGDSDTAKRIELSVYYLLSNYATFHNRSQMSYTVKLGNGEEIQKTVNHASGAGAHQDLNGCIADGVVALLSDEQILAYLAE